MHPKPVFLSLSLSFGSFAVHNKISFVRFTTHPRIHGIQSNLIQSGLRQKKLFFSPFAATKREREKGAIINLISGAQEAGMGQRGFQTTQKKPRKKNAKKHLAHSLNTHTQLYP